MTFHGTLSLRADVEVNISILEDLEEDLPSHPSYDTVSFDGRKRCLKRKF